MPPEFAQIGKKRLQAMVETQNEVFGAVQEMNRDLLKLPAGEVAPLVL